MQALVQCPVMAAGRLDDDKLDTGLVQHPAQTVAPAGVIRELPRFTRRCDVDVEMGLADIDADDHLFPGPSHAIFLTFPILCSRRAANATSPTRQRCRLRVGHN